MLRLVVSPLPFPPILHQCLSLVEFRLQYCWQQALRNVSDNRELRRVRTMLSINKQYLPQCLSHVAYVLRYPKTRERITTFICSFIHSFMCLLGVGIFAPLNKIKYVKALVIYVILSTPLTNLNCEFPK